MHLQFKTLKVHSAGSMPQHGSLRLMLTGGIGSRTPGYGENKRFTSVPTI